MIVEYDLSSVKTLDSFSIASSGEKEAFACGVDMGGILLYLSGFLQSVYFVVYLSGVWRNFLSGLSGRTSARLYGAVGWEISPSLWNEKE